MKFFPNSFFILYTITLAKCYNILVVFSVDGHSHQTLGESLAKGLSVVGHNVTFLTPLSVKNPGNIRVIQFQGSFLDDSKEKNTRVNLFEYENYPEMLPLLFNKVEKIISENFFKDKKVRHLLSSPNETFDAIILEQFHNDAKKYLAYHFKCPLILYSSIFSSKWVNRFVGNPEPPSYVSDELLNYNGPMNFFQRTHNFLFGLFNLYRLEVVSGKIQNSILKKNFPDAPTVQELNYNVSLVFINSHVSISPAVPRVPNMIDIGGHHIKHPKDLPKSLQEYMDTADEGIIYFSMGSNLLPSDMPEEIRNIILQVLGARKEKVLFKWNEDNLENVRSNIKISKWFPQSDILAHPKLKLFITHCGLLSTTEVLYHGVPILALPIYSDQKLNAAQAEAIGIGKYLIFSKITTEMFTKALVELLDNPKISFKQKKIIEIEPLEAKVEHFLMILMAAILVFYTDLEMALDLKSFLLASTTTPESVIPQSENERFFDVPNVLLIKMWSVSQYDDPFRSYRGFLKSLHFGRYKENAKARSKIMHDRPMKPIETAIYWTEYVIRHNGAKHLRVVGTDLPFYQYFLFDVVAVLLFLLTLFITVTFLLMRRILKIIIKSQVVDIPKVKNY